MPLLKKITNAQKISILTDHYHYSHLKNRNSWVTQCDYFHLIKRTRRWKRWFENRVLCVDLVKKGVDYSQSPSQKILSSLFACYKRALRSLDSEEFGKPRITPIVDVIKKMRCEVLEEVEIARKIGYDEPILSELLRSFREIETKVDSWLCKETDRSSGDEAK